MLIRLAMAGLAGYFYGRAANEARARGNLLATLAIQEEEGGRTLARIREAKAAEIPDWLDPLLVRHIADEARHAKIFRRAVALENLAIDDQSPAVARAAASVGEGSLKRFYATEDLSAVPLVQLLASVLIAEENGVRGFRSLLRTLPESREATRAGVASVLADEERHVSYLRDALVRLRGSRAAEQMRSRIEEQVRTDLGKIVEYLLTRREQPVLVKQATPEIEGETKASP